ncbi:hypothetical protein [Streptomyces sp. NPDC057909]
MITIKRSGDAEAAYRKLIGHTVTCTGCRAGAPCPTAVQLGRAWRMVRR